MNQHLDFERIYLHLPVVLQNTVTNFHGWRINRSRFNQDFYRTLEDVELRGSLDVSSRLTYRDEALQKFIVHAANTVPYYQMLFAKLGINSLSIHSLADLECLPILKKEMVQEHMADLISQIVPKQEQVMVHTSGTTGGGLRFPTTWSAIHTQWAIWWRYRHFHNLREGTWCGYFGGRSIVPLVQRKPPYWRFNSQGRQILFSAYHISSKTIKAYVRELNRKKPPWLHGYPSLLALLASLMIEQDISLDYCPRWITVGAESLHPQQVLLIKQVFGIRPIQHYGMAEGVANVSQHPDGNLYVDEDFAAVEFIHNPGGGYNVIGTNFTNYAMPLIRYEVGDIVELPDEIKQDDWGRQIINIDGRKEDYIILSNGARLGRMDHIFKDMVNIREAQIYQRQPGKIEIRIVRNISYTDRDEEMLLQEFRKRTGPFAEIAISYMSKLERTSTGKLRFVISDLVEGQLFHQ